MKQKLDPLVRFESKFRRGAEDECWLWTGWLSNGYGSFSANGVPRGAHAWAYRFYVGEVPPGLQIDHICRVKNCVNPKHLRAVTASENMKNRVMSKQTLVRIVALVSDPVYHDFEVARSARGVRVSQAAFAEAVIAAGLKVV